MRHQENSKTYLLLTFPCLPHRLSLLPTLLPLPLHAFLIVFLFLTLLLHPKTHRSPQLFRRPAKRIPLGPSQTPRRPSTRPSSARIRRQRWFLLPSGERRKPRHQQPLRQPTRHHLRRSPRPPPPSPRRSPSHRRRYRPRRIRFLLPTTATRRRSWSWSPIPRRQLR